MAHRFGHVCDTGRDILFRFFYNPFTWRYTMCRPMENSGAAVDRRATASNPLYSKEICMTIDEVILELYRLAETKKWGGKKTDAALVAAIDGMEQIWLLRQNDKRKNSGARPFKKQPRIWS